MAKGIRCATPTDPEELLRYQTRRAQNNASAKKHRDRMRQMLEDGRKHKNMYDQVLAELKLQTQRLTEVENENRYLLDSLHKHKCYASSQPVGFTTPALPLQDPNQMNISSKSFFPSLDTARAVPFNGYSSNTLNQTFFTNQPTASETAASLATPYMLILLNPTPPQLMTEPFGINTVPQSFQQPCNPNSSFSRRHRKNK